MSPTSASAPTSAPSSSSAPWCSSRTERRTGAALVGLGVVLFVLGATYGIASPFYYGHYGYHGGSYATWARGTLRHHTIYPVNEPGFAPPVPQNYYIHHPVLTHQLVTFTFAVFGQHEWSVRLAALIPSFASLLLVAAIAWRYLGPLSGGAASVIFALVPVNVWYESHIDQGFPSIAFLLAFFWFYLGWLGSGRWRLGFAALFSELMAGNFEWSPYFAFPAIFAHVLVVALRRRGRYLTFAALHPLTVILPLGFHFILVSHAHLIGDLRVAYGNRTSEIAYGAFARTMRDYAETLFGPALMVVMVAWLALVLVRRATGRGRSLDLVGVTFAFALITYWHVFKMAVVTHAYRQLYGNVWATLAVADLVAEGRRFGRRAFAVPRGGGSWASGSRWAGTAVAGCVLAAVTLFTAPISWGGLLESRLHGGVPQWKTFNPDLRQTAFAIRVQATTHPGDLLYFHDTFPNPPPHRMDWAFYYDRDLRRSTQMQALLTLPQTEREHAVVIFFPAQLSSDELRAFAALAAHHPVWEVEDLALLDLRVEGEQREAFRLAPVDRSATNALERWLEGPYPFPVLVRDRALGSTLAALITQGLAPPRPVPLAVPAARAGGREAVDRKASGSPARRPRAAVRPEARRATVHP